MQILARSKSPTNLRHGRGLISSSGSSHAAFLLGEVLWLFFFAEKASLIFLAPALEGGGGAECFGRKKRGRNKNNARDAQERCAQYGEAHGVGAG